MLLSEITRCYSSSFSFVSEFSCEQVYRFGIYSIFSIPQMRSHGDSKVTLSYKYFLHEELQSSIENNLVQEDTAYFEWALKKWSHCSRPCGGNNITSSCIQLSNNLGCWPTLLVLLPLHFLLIEVLGWVYVKHFLKTADVKKSFIKYIWLIDLLMWVVSTLFPL